MEHVIIKYNFYNDYLYSNDFLEIFNKRKKYIKNKYNFKLCDDELIKEYFVEIFSWTVINKHTLNDINTVINKYLPNGTIIDPCSGNSFHTFLFNKFLNYNIITIDIQPEPNAWVDTIEDDGLDYIKKIENHSNKILLLSWIDYTHNELPYNLLINFKGDLVISIGNYREVDCKKYMDELTNKYKLLKEYYCKMPWDSVEEIKLYYKCK